MNRSPLPDTGAIGPRRSIVLAADPAMLGARPVEEAFQIVAEAGYSALELSPRSDFLPGFGRQHASSARVRAVAHAAHEAALEIASLMVVYNWASPDDETDGRLYVTGATRSRSPPTWAAIA